MNEIDLAGIVQGLGNYYGEVINFVPQPLVTGSGNRIVFNIVESEGEVIGHCKLTLDLTLRVIEEIDLLARGYGDEAVQIIFSIAADLGIEHIRASTGFENMAARRLFERSGFNVIGTGGEGVVYEIDLMK